MIDDLVMTDADPWADLWATLDAFALPDLLRLQANLGNLVRGAYQDAHGRGCLLFFLTGGNVTTKQELLNHPFPDETTLLVARRLVRHFDAGVFTTCQLGNALQAAIDRRLCVNALEDAAVQRAHRPLPAALAA